MMNERLLSIKTQNNNNKLNEISVADRIEYIELKLESINTELKGNPDRFDSILSLHEQSGFKKLVLAFPIIECIDYLQDEYFKLAETYYYSDKNSFYSQIDYYKRSEALQSTVDNNDLYNLVNSIVDNGVGLARLYTEISKTKNTNRLELKIKHTLRDVDTFYDESIFSSIQYKTIADFYVDKDQVLQESDLANYAIDDTTGNYVDYRSAELLYNYENLLNFISNLQKDLLTLTETYYEFKSTDLNSWENRRYNWSLDHKKVSFKQVHGSLISAVVFMYLKSHKLESEVIRNALVEVLPSFFSESLSIVENRVKHSSGIPFKIDTKLNKYLFEILSDIRNSKISINSSGIDKVKMSGYVKCTRKNTHAFLLFTKGELIQSKKKILMNDVFPYLQPRIQKILSTELDNIVKCTLNYFK